MKKCIICLVGSWTVGLSALAWAAVGVIGEVPPLPLWARVLAVAVGLTGIGFLVYQPPLKPCPRCVAAHQ